MKPQTRELVERSVEKFAQIYGAPNGNASETFNVTEPNVQQRLDEKIRESSDFLQKINFVGVDQLKGEKLEMDVQGPISRRNTPLTSRTKNDPSEIAKRSYELHEVQRDVMIPWKKLDTWSGAFNKFYAMFRNLVIKQRAHDILMTGWNGQRVAPVTNPITNPMLQDNAIGWIQQIINHAPEKLLGLNPDGSIDEIRVGPGAGVNGFENMDELVMALNGMIDKPFRTRTDLMAITGDDLVTDSYLKMYASFVEPTEKPMIDLYITGNRFGRRPIAESAHFPQRGVLLTPFANLSRYTQNGTLRMKVTDDDELMCLIDYYYAYEAFPVEMFDTVAGVHPDAISIKTKAGDWVPLAAEDKWKVVA